MSRHLAIVLVCPDETPESARVGQVLQAVCEHWIGATMLGTFILEDCDDGSMRAPDGVPFEVGRGPDGEEG